MSDDQPDPECPTSCGSGEDAPPVEFCVCEVFPFGGGGPPADGYCSDLRWYAGYMPADVGFGGGTGVGGTLPPPPDGSDAGTLPPSPGDPDAG